MATKNPTRWLNPNRQGSVVSLGNIFLTDNAGNFLTDNAGNFLVTNTSFSKPNNVTTWVPTGAR